MFSCFNSSSTVSFNDKCFQDAIFSGELASVEYAPAEGQINKALPNGELPLHYAVREGKTDVAQQLIKQGANPLQKDDQGLTAIDYALNESHADMLPILFGKKASDDFSAAVEQHGSYWVSSAFSHITKTIKQTSSNQNLSEIEKAALKGDNETLKTLLKSSPSKDLNLMHLAAMGNSQDVIDTLKSYGLKLTDTDKNGRTPAHYAAANPNGTILGHFARLGADLTAKESNGAAVLSVLGEAAKARDPLNLSKAHCLMFAGTVVQAAVTLGIESGYIGQEHQLTALALLLGTSMVANYSELAVQLQHIDKSWKKGLVWLGFFGLEALPVVGTPFKVWRTYSVASSAFEGIKTAYSNARYQTWKAARNAVVLTTNAGTSASNLWTRLTIDYEVCLNGSYMAKLYFATDEEERIKILEEYMEFLRSRYNIKFEDSNASFKTVDPSEFKDLGVVDRLNHEKLNPEYPEHALLMIDPSFTMEQLQEKGSSLYRKAYRKLMLNHVHPDKIKDESATAAAMRLGAARATLDECVNSIDACVRDHRARSA